MPDLFDSERSELEDLFLSINPTEDVTQLAAECYTVQELKQILGSLSFYELPGSVTRKRDLAVLTAKLYSDKRLFDSLMEGLGDRASRMIRRVVWDGVQDSRELLAEFGGESELPAPFFLHQVYGRSVSVPGALLGLLRELVSPLPLETESWEEDPPGDFRFSAAEGEELYRNLDSLMRQMEDQGLFNRRSDEKILKKPLTALLKNSGISPFAPAEDAGRDAAEFRLVLIIRVITFILSADPYSLPAPPREPAEPLAFLKEGVESLFTSPWVNFDLTALLPHVRVKQRDRYLDFCRDYRPAHSAHFLNFLKRWPYEDWVSFDFCVAMIHRYTTAMPLIPDREMYYTIRENNYGYRDSYKCYIDTELKYKRVVNDPYFSSLFSLLGALGLFELSWYAPPPDDESPWNPLGDLTALRMTDLGRAVFGHTAGYDGGRQEADRTVRLDSRFPAAYMDKGNRAAVSFFRTIGTPLGESTVKVNAEMITKSCRSREEAVEKFDTILRYSGGELPSVWEALKQDVLGRFASLKGETDWTVYSLDGADGRLRDYLTAGCPYFSRMEGDRIAVRQEDLRKFHAFLKKGGFILDGS